MTDDAILVSVHLLEGSRRHFQLLAVLAEDVLEGQVLQLRGSQVPDILLLLVQATYHQIDGVSLIATDQQDLLKLMDANGLQIISFKFLGSNPDRTLGLLDDLDEILLQLVPEHLPKGGNLRILVTILFDAIDDTHCPFDSDRLQPILLVEKGVHMCLQGLH